MVLRSMFEMMRAGALGAALVALAVAPACKKSPPPSEPQQAPVEAAGPTATKPEAATPEPAETPPAANDPVLVTVGDEKITVPAVRQRVEAQMERGKVAPASSVLDETVEDMIETSVLAQSARAAGFTLPEGAPDTSDHALAMAFAQEASRKAGPVEVSDADLADFFAERRLAAQIVMADRDKASELARQYRDAVAVDGTRANAVFQEMWNANAIREARGQRRNSTPFDLQGEGALGQTVVHPRVAGAAFALKAPGDISPPVSLENNYFVLVQLREIQPATDVATLPPEALARAKRTIEAGKVLARRDAVVAELREKIGVEIDPVALDQLRASLSAAPVRATRIPGMAVRQQLKGVRPASGDPRGVQGGVQRLQKPSRQEIIRRLRDKTRETTP